jgi:hypothetical protein
MPGGVKRREVVLAAGPGAASGEDRNCVLFGSAGWTAG